MDQIDQYDARVWLSSRSPPSTVLLPGYRRQLRGKLQEAKGDDENLGKLHRLSPYNRYDLQSLAPYEKELFAAYDKQEFMKNRIAYWRWMVELTYCRSYHPVGSSGWNERWNHLIGFSEKLGALNALMEEYNEKEEELRRAIKAKNTTNSE